MASHFQGPAPPKRNPKQKALIQALTLREYTSRILSANSGQADVAFCRTGKTIAGYDTLDIFNIYYFLSLNRHRLDMYDFDTGMAVYLEPIGSHFDIARVTVTI